MVKKLFLKVFTFWAFILTSILGWGQCPTSVNITASPGTTICAGEPVEFTAALDGTGTNLLYQWQVNGVNEGSKTSSNTFTGNTLQDGHTVRVVVTADCLATPLTSNSLAVTVNPIPTVTTANTATICSGTGPNIALNASTPSSFSWTVGTVTGGITGASAGSGSTINQILTNPSSSAAGTVQYIVTPTATTGNCEGYPYTITVTVNPKPLVTTTNSITVCSGTSPNISLSASTPSSFSWTVGSITGGITGASAGSGSTINQTLTNTGNTTGTVQYVVTPTANAGSCTGAPYTITVTVNSKPTITTASSATICSETSPNIPLTASTPSTFSWTVGSITGGITGASAGSGSTINQTLTNPSSSSAGTVQYIVTPTAATGNCAGEPYTITVTVNPKPTVTTANSATICSGASPNIPLTASTPGTFSWTVGSNTGNISGASAGSGSTINQTLTNPGNSTAGTVQYIVTPTATTGSCEGEPYTITVTVNPEPTVTTANSATVCSGASPNIPLTASTPSTFSWIVGSNTGNISGASAGNGSTIDQTLTNPSNSSAGTVQYIVTPTATTGSCEGEPYTITVTVNPKPTVTTANSATVCSGFGPNISLAASTPGSFSWTVGTVTGGITGASAGNGSTINQTLINPSNSTAGTVEYIVTPTANAENCAGEPYTITVTVNPTLIPSVTISSTSTDICTSTASGSTPVTFTATPVHGGASPTYEWRRNGSGISGATGATYTASSLADGSQISVVMTSNATCGSPVTATSNVITIKGYTPPATPVFDPVPTQGGPVNTTLLCPPNTGLVYKVASDPNVTSYNWTLPTGWVITAGAETNSITINNSNLNAGTYNLVATAMNACGSSSTTLPVTIEKAASVYAGADTSICMNGSYSITDSDYSGYINSGGQNAPTWTVSPAGSGSFSNIKAKNPTFTPSKDFIGSITLTLTSTKTTGNFNCAQLSDKMILTVNAPPAITAQPSTTAQILCLNAAATQLSVSATGAGLTYQWYSNTTNSNTGGTAINGATSATYTPVTTTHGILYYYVVVSGTCTPSLTSNVSGAVTVNAPPAITAQPSTTEQIVCPNDTSTPLSVTATGTGLTYQWYSNTTNANTGGTAINGATSATYTPATTASGTLYYYVTVEGTCAPAVTSSVAGAVTVNAPPEITVQPSTAEQTLCLEDTATELSVTATGAGLTYQWYSNTTSSNSGGTAVNGATSSSYTPATATAGSLYYYVVVSGTCTPAVSSNVTGAITVNAPPEITAQPSATEQTLCLEDPAAELSITATGEDLTYQWYSNSTNANSGGTAISGATSATYTPVTTSSGTLYYYVIVEGACTPAVTSSVSGAVTVNAPPEITAQPATTEQTLCPDDPAVELSVTATGAGLTYQWFSNSTNANTGGTAINGATSATYIPVTTSSGTLYYYAIVSGTCTPAVTSSVSGAVTVNAVPEITDQPSTTEQTLCLEDPAAELTVTATGEDLTYQWYSNSTNTNSGGTAISGATSSIYTPATTSSGTLYYYVIVSGTCTPAVTSNVSGAVTVNEPVEIITDLDDSTPVEACAGFPVEFSIESTGTGLTYEWTKDGNPVGTNSPTLTIAQVAASDAGLYTVLVKGTAPCADVQSTKKVELKVNQSIIITSQPEATYPVCLGGSAVEIAVVATGNIYDYVWRKNGIPISDGAKYSGTGTANLIIKDLALEDSDNYDVVISSPEGSCSQIISHPATVTVYSPPEVEAREDIEVCSTSTSLDLGTGATASNYSTLIWTTNGLGQILNATDLNGATYVPVAADFGNTLTFTLTAKLEVGGVQVCEDAVDTRSLTIVAQPVITEFSYLPSDNSAVSTEFCETDITTYTPHIAGNNLTNGTGLFSVDDTALTINPTTGTITPNGTSPGEYSITYTYTITSQEAGCTAAEKIFKVTIGEKPVAEFTYGETPFCSDSSNTSPTFLNGGVAGIFSSSKEGLVFVNASTGEIDFAASTPDTYEVTNTVDYSAQGCAVVTHTAPITINKKPIPDFTYSEAEYCSDPNVEQTIIPIPEVGAVKGTFSYTAIPEGSILSLDTTTGNIDIMTSEAGSYIITNTVEIEDDGCDVVEGSFSINIEKRSNPSFEYTSTSFCISTKSASVVSGFETGGTFSSPTLGSKINATTGAITWTETDDITGPHEITYTISGKGLCEDVSSTVDIVIDPLPVGGKLAFEDLVNTNNNGRIFMICEGATSGYLPITLSGHTGNILAWKYSINGAPWITIPGEEGNFTGNVLSASTIQGLNLPETTVFRVEIGSGACSPNVFSQTAILSVIPTDITPSPVTVSESVVCLGDTVTLSSETGYTNSVPTVENGNFDNAGLKNKGWRFRLDGKDMNFETNANNTNQDFWSRATPHNFNTANYNTSPYSMSPMRWDAGIEDGNKGFAMVSGDHNATMETNIFSIGAMDQAIVTFDQAYNLTPGATITVEISEDGGQNYETVLFSISGSATSGNYSSFGTGTPQSRLKNKMVLDLGNYLGKSNLRLKFTFDGARDGDIWAVDGIKLPEGPRNVTIEWNDYTNPQQVIPIGTTNSVQYAPKQIGLNVFEVKTKLVFDSTGNACEVAENAENIEVFVFDKYTTSVSAEYGSCGNFEAQLSASVLNGKNEPVISYPTPDGFVGKWSIEGAGATLVDSNPTDNIAAENDPNATLLTTAAGTYNVSWILEPTEVDENGNLYENPETCAPDVSPLEVVIAGCIALDFDGQDDHIIIDDPYNNVVSFEAWIRPAVAGGTIISGPNFNISTPNAVTPNSRWYHIAISNGKLYLDGIERSNLALGNGNGSRTVIGAELVNGEAQNLFSGWIEEVRLWNKALTVEQIRFMMNQRLIANGTQMGEQILMNVPGGLNYSDLAGYYRLISATPEPLPTSPVIFLPEDMPLDGLTPDRAATASPGRLVNMETNQENTAPLPYYSGKDGIWGTDDTWLRPEVWDPPHTGTIDWNIVKTSHHITSGNRDITVLGLLSESNVLDMEGANPTGWTSGGSGNRLFISHYLLLDGIIDLNGESQLIQPDGSIVDQTSGINREITGFLDRDQQGTASSYNYNYWSSPVSPGSLNADYSVGTVMMDGTTPTPAKINFGNAYNHADAGFTNPRKVSAYWLHKFHGTANNYFRWEHIGSTGALQVGEGYSMKGTSGSAAILDPQNYTFRGLPNNGTILMETMNATGTGENYLLGNPYPSAIDADEFILDNMRDVINGRNTSNVFNGTIYFWSHFANKTHYLEEYIGGYATYNLSGGVIAVAIDDRINATEDEGGRIPQQFIPVGQGFFVNTRLDPEIVNISNITIHGGQVTFRNNQRLFITENDAKKSVFHSQEKKEISGIEGTNTSKAEQQRIWLKFKSPKGYYRQILVTADPNATDNFDLGYDAPLIENNVEDMYWYFNNNEFVIQGVEDFNVERELQLGVKIKEQGVVKISIDRLGNIAEDQEIFLKDSITGTIHNLKNEPYTIEVEEGVFTDRFKLVFKDDETPVVEPEDPVVVDDGPFKVQYLNEDRIILIKNPELIKVNRIYLNNLTGQQVHVYYNIPLTIKEELPVERFSAGVYILKLHTAQGIITKKVILE
ncbi:PKD-like domain-containing protein [Salinimicrobium sp. WS361]|uniref:PKD-like domain-containing protein n=1 Tax=Salinimicrobium sp. WS361 TaxID=3425123 RepID=UPI003D6FE40B